MSVSTLNRVKLNFSGGCELLFDKTAEMTIDNVVPTGSTLSDLVQLIKDKYVLERPELFVDATGRNIRPGILVLVNSCDAEVMGGMAYVVEEGDEVDFISTLHGG